MKHNQIRKILLSLSAALVSAAGALLPVEASSVVDTTLYRIRITVTWEEDAYVQPVTVSYVKKEKLHMARISGGGSSTASSLQSFTFDGQNIMFDYLEFKDAGEHYDLYMPQETHTFSLEADSTTRTLVTEDYDTNYHSGTSNTTPRRLHLVTFEADPDILDAESWWIDVYGFHEYGEEQEEQDALTVQADTYEQCNTTVSALTNESEQSLGGYPQIIGVTVTYSPKYVSVTLRKVWDSSVPEEERQPVTVHLTRDGEVYPEGSSYVLSEENEWSYTITDLLQYDPDSGEAYTYSMTEDGSDYETSVSSSTSGSTVTLELTNSLSSTPTPTATPTATPESSTPVTPAVPERPAVPNTSDRP